MLASQKFEKDPFSIGQISTGGSERVSKPLESVVRSL